MNWTGRGERETEAASITKRGQRAIIDCILMFMWLGSDKCYNLVRCLTIYYKSRI
jgi:hypothetical protein